MEQKEQRAKYKRRLRSVLIHKPMQREFTLVVISLLIISTLTVGFVIHHTIREAMMGGGFRFGKITPYEIMSDVTYDLITRVSLVLFITILIIALFGVFFLHRIAGPVYRFRSILRQVVKGEIPEEFKLREGDYFTETADDLNTMLRMLRLKRQRVESLSKRLDQIAQKGETTALAQFKEELNKLA